MGDGAPAMQLSVADVEAWCDAHPLEFDELVAAKASPAGVRNWHEVVKMPASRLQVDPTIVHRVSRLVRRSVESVRESCNSSTARQVADASLPPDRRFAAMLLDIGASLSMAELGRRLCRDMPALVGARQCRLYLRHCRRDKLVCYGGPEKADGVAVDLAGVVAAVISSGTTVVRNADPAKVAEAAASGSGAPASVIAAPIRGKGNALLGVLELRDKEGDPAGTGAFSQADEEVLAKMLPFCGVAIRNAQTFEQALLEARWSNILLGLAKNLFENLDSTEMVVTRIMVNAVALLSCEKCSVFMVDFKTNELYAKVFDLSPNGENDASAAAEIRFPMHVGIAGHVATSGEVLNIPDAYKDNRFNQAVDKQTGFTTRSILCMPIYAGSTIVGVAQLVNKVDGPFSEKDEELFEGFAVFCGLSISAAGLYEEACANASRHRVALEVLQYHAVASEDETDVLCPSAVPTARSLNLHIHSLDCSTLSDEQLPLAIIRMFADCNFIHHFRIPYRSLCRWVISVRKNYRAVTYHNWRHAFGVSHTMFYMMRTAGLGKHLSPIEMLALLVACISHDLDHRGTNNGFEELRQSDLSKLYCTSTMERHHFDMAVILLNCPENNILINLSVAEYTEFLKILEHAILATDISTYLSTREHYQNLIATSTFSWEDEAHRKLFRAMLMTASDLSAVSRPWSVQRKIAEVVYAEFYEQGAREREFGKTPDKLFDDTKSEELPQMQIGFIDFICLPVYQSLANHLPPLTVQRDAVLVNRKRWTELAAAGKFQLAKRTPPVDDPGQSTLLENLQVSQAVDSMGPSGRSSHAAYGMRPIHQHHLKAPGKDSAGGETTVIVPLQRTVISAAPCEAAEANAEAGAAPLSQQTRRSGMQPTPAKSSACGIL